MWYDDFRLSYISNIEHAAVAERINAKCVEITHIYIYIYTERPDAFVEQICWKLFVFAEVLVFV